MAGHNGAHPYGRSTDRARRTDARRVRTRRLRVTQLIIFSILVIAIVGIGWFSWIRLLSPSTQDGTAASAPPPTSASGILCPDPGALPSEPESVSVRVLNGTARTGLAGKVTGSLDSRGYEMGAAGNTSDADGPVTIVFGRSGYLQARSVAVQFPHPQFRLDDREDSDVDVLIGSADVKLTAKKSAASALQEPAPAPKGCAAG